MGSVVKSTVGESSRRVYILTPISDQPIPELV